VFTVDGIRKFHGWMHSSLDLVLNHVSTIPANDYVREVPGFGFATVREQAIHILNCEGFWVSTLRGAAYANRSAAECPDLAALRLMQRQVSQETYAYLSTLTDQQLDATTELRFSDGDVCFRTPAFILHHALTHAFHHKGQIVAMCRLLGYPAPDTDLSEVHQGSGDPE
jgi:uncharacterized damage-inducible protein DinB